MKYLYRFALSKNSEYQCRCQLNTVRCPPAPCLVERTLRFPQRDSIRNPGGASLSLWGFGCLQYSFSRTAEFKSILLMLSAICRVLLCDIILVDRSLADTICYSLSARLRSFNAKGAEGFWDLNGVVGICRKGRRGGMIVLG